VLDELSKWLEKPIARSAAVATRADDPVALVDEHKVPLRETLEALERLEHLHITVEALRLRVETDEDYRDRNRHLVDLSLRDYGTFFVPRDFPARELGWQASIGGNGIAMFQAGDGVQAPDPHELLDYVAKSATHGSLELRGNGNVFVWVTPQEEAEVRKALEETYRAAMKRTEWRVVFGTMPPADAPAGGIVARADADALAARLKDAHTLALTSLNGQRVNSSTNEQRAILADADVVSSHLDPKVTVLTSGRSADLTACTGFGFDWVSYHLAWSEPLPDRQPAEVRNAGVPRAGGDASVTLKKEDAGPVTATVSGGDTAIQRGEALGLTQPTQWTWQPRGECYLRRGSAMVFVAQHPAGRAVIMLEETLP
jgi:hypothetical protein